MTPAIQQVKKTRSPLPSMNMTMTRAFVDMDKKLPKKLGIDPALLFKTLVVFMGSKGLAVGVVPVSGQLDLKAIANALGAKKAAMADKQQAERSTGYITGGISPLGQKKQLPTIIDVSALELDRVFVSAGRRGLQISLSPTDLATLTQAFFHGISKH